MPFISVTKKIFLFQRKCSCGFFSLIWKENDEWKNNSGEADTFKRCHLFQNKTKRDCYLSQKYLFESINSLQCHGLNTRCSPLPLILSSPLTYAVIPLVCTSYMRNKVGYEWTNYCHHSGLPDSFQQLLGIITSCQVIIIFPLRDSGCMTSRLLLGWLHGQLCSKPLVMNDLKSGVHTSHMRIAVYV